MLVDFSEPLDGELQAVWGLYPDLPRVVALCVGAGIYAALPMKASATLRAEVTAGPRSARGHSLLDAGPPRLSWK